MHADAYAFVANAARAHQARGPVYEIGSRSINGSVRSIFVEKGPYLGLDCAEGSGVDVVGNGATFTPPVRPNTVVCCEVLEHTPEAEAIVRQAATVLAPGGLLIITTAANGRQPHSAVDGGPLRAGEFYRNLTVSDVEAWARGADIDALQAHEGTTPADLYFAGRKRGTPVATTRPLKLLVAGPGASWSTADVDEGLRYGLASHGVEIVRYRLDARIDRAKRWLYTSWRHQRKQNRELEKPSVADVFYQAGLGLVEMALRHQVDAVLIVSAMFMHPDVIILLKRAGVHVVVLFTESPYDLEKELAIAHLVDGCWTNERSSVSAFLTLNPQSGYIPHAWHPGRHTPGAQPGDEQIAAHDVVFVGSAFRERIAFLSAIDWTGIDFGLYGSWSALGTRHPLRQYLRGGQVTNSHAAALYRRAKIGLNLYRTSMGFGRYAPQISHAESLNPRAYELAACGAFSLSDYRAEVAEVFGERVPTFRTPSEASTLIRRWLADDAGRTLMASQLPACVAESSWVQRSAQVIGDLASLLRIHAA